MNLYYNFNGLWDYEYSITPSDVVEAMKYIENILIDESDAECYFDVYHISIYNFFRPEALSSFLKEIGSGDIEENIIKRKPKGGPRKGGFRANFSFR